jgi:hypothetical protein
LLITLSGALKASIPAGLKFPTSGLPPAGFNVAIGAESKPLRTTVSHG